MKFEIEIDEKLFRGWEPVAFRVPKDGEYFAQISDDNNEFYPDNAEIWEEIYD